MSTTARTPWRWLMMTLLALAVGCGAPSSEGPSRDPDAGASDQGEPDADPEAPDAEAPDVPNDPPDADPSDADAPDDLDAAPPDAEQPDAEAPDAEQPDVDEPDAEEPDADEPDAEELGPEEAPMWIADWEALVEGVEDIEHGGAVPSSIVVFGQGAFPVLFDEGSLPWVAAARHGQGRAWHAAHESHIRGKLTAGAGDTDRLVLNAVRWLAADREAPVIGVSAGVPELRTFLEGHGFQVVTTTPGALEGVDVFASDSYNFSPQDADALKRFVADGGGLLTAGLAWWWTYQNGGAPAVGYPGNLVLAEFGMVVTGDTTRAGHDGVLGSAPGLELHAAGALEVMLRHLRGQPAQSPERLALAALTISHAARWLPLDWPYFSQEVQSLIEATPEIVPSAQRPLTVADTPVERVVMALQVKQALEAAPDAVEAHPAARDFPGAVPESVAPQTRTLTVHGTWPGRPGEYQASNARAPLWHSTGLYAAPGAVITVRVPEAIAGQGIKAQIGCHSDQLWGAEGWSRAPNLVRAEPLEAAQTRLASGFGGPVYVTIPTGATLGDFEVTVEGAVPMPRFVLGATTPQQWAQERTHQAPWAEIASDRLILTLPSAEVAALDDPTEVARTWAQVMDAAAALEGSDPEARLRPERFVVDRQISAGWMHSGYPLMAHLQSTAEFLDLANMARGQVWGPFHEIGHNHQWSAWMLPGTGEANVNLWSVYINEAVFGVGRGQTHPAISADQRQQRVRDYLAGGANFQQWQVWTALETYLQLEEAFGWALYQTLLPWYRALPPDQVPTSDTERIDLWVVRTSQVAGMNLTGFYRAWGFPLSPWVEDALADLPPWTDHPLSNP